MIKNNIETVRNGRINYLKKNGSKVKYKPWLGDLFSFLYDMIMNRSIFPNKFEASLEKHNTYLENEYKNIHNSDVLELATGSGNIAELLPTDNNYTGIDISKGLLKKAYKRYNKAGFEDPQLFLCSAEELPFKEKMFDICICNLSLNFFDELEKVIKEINRVLNNNGKFICSVPVPERNKKQSVIRGKLYSEEELKELFESYGFNFTSYDYRNGALLYFEAVL